MIYPLSDIATALAALGLKSTDIVMIHADAAIAAQYIYDPDIAVNDNARLMQFIKALTAYFDKGCVIVPAFSYCATAGSIFDPATTPSAVGQFSENFRQSAGVIRSRHPIFSVSCWGEQAAYFANSAIETCFGPHSFFDKFHQKNGKILTLGCAFDRVTFVHFVEQAYHIPYRYHKDFEGLIKDRSGLTKQMVSYFVRDLEMDMILDLSQLEEAAIKAGKMVKSALGRFPARVITAHDFYDLAGELLAKDPFSLVRKAS